MNTSEKVLFVPPMDPFAAPLAAAVFRSVGYDARVLEENPETLAIGLQHTGGGECVPCPSTTGALIAAMRRADLPPEKVVFFMPTTCGPCRFGQYVELNRQIFKRMGWEAIRILSPASHNAYAGLSAGVRLRLWRGMVVADVLRRMLLRVRPYEIEPGSTERLLSKHFKKLQQAFESPDLRVVEGMIGQTAEDLAALPRSDKRRPRVGVVGEIYVRFNTFINADVCRRIEELGGEAMLAPMCEWVLYTNALRRIEARQMLGGLRGLAQRLRCAFDARFLFAPWERRYTQRAAPVLGDVHEPSINAVMAAGAEHLPWQCAGETILTLGRAALFVTRDGARAIVNVSPIFCMPGTISTSIFPTLERELNTPVVCNFYDGSGDGNAALVPLMHYLVQGTQDAK